jgi:hypothetical protein
LNSTGYYSLIVTVLGCRLALNKRSERSVDMRDTTRIVLIALGIALLVLVLLPLLFMTGMMSMMGGMMGHMMNGTIGAGFWVMGGLVLLVVVAVVVLLVAGLRRGKSAPADPAEHDDG